MNSMVIVLVSRIGYFTPCHKCDDASIVAFLFVEDALNFWRIHFCVMTYFSKMEISKMLLYCLRIHYGVMYHFPKMKISFVM